MAAWQLEEYGRRHLMARLEFAKQAIADGSYLVLLAGSLIAITILAQPTLLMVLIAMTAAAFGSFVIAMLFLPRSSRLGRPRWSAQGIRVVSQYGVWRAAESGLAYVSQILVRVVVVAFSSLAVMGELEAARLMVAPLLTALAGLNNVALPAFANSHRRVSARNIHLATAALSLLVGVYAGAVLLLGSEISRALFGGKIDVSTVPLIGWLLAAAALGIVLPYRTELLTQGRSASVFASRVVAAVLGLAIAVLVVVAAHPAWAPVAVGVGNAVGAAVIWIVWGASRMRGEGPPKGKSVAMGSLRNRMPRSVRPKTRGSTT